MGSWSGLISGLTPVELDSLTNYLKQKAAGREMLLPKMGDGDQHRGETNYNTYCKACHGTDAKGGVAVALNQDGFLKRADNAFIFKTVMQGRGNTAMPGWSHLEAGEVADLVTYLRSLSNAIPPSNDLNLELADLKEGALKYHFLCSRCHGEFGEGETGPAIINRDFLGVASNN